MGKILPGIYMIKPKGFSEDIISCSCIMIFENEILFLKKAKGQWSENLFGVPCGKVEVQEDIYKTMRREIKEEIGYVVEKDHLKYLDKIFIVQEDNVCNIQYIFCYKLSEKIIVKLSNEHSDYKWIHKDKLSSVNLIPFQEEVLIKVSDVIFK